MIEEERVFDKSWFKKHQKGLLWLANSWFGSHIFHFKSMGYRIKNPIEKITPNSVSELIWDEKHGIQHREHFFSRNEYARELYFVLLPLWYAMHFWDWVLADRLAPSLSFGFTTLTQYSQSIGTDNPVDGYVGENISNPGVVWSTLVGDPGNDSATGHAIGSGANNLVVLQASSTTNQFKSLYRIIMCFDTSSLTSGASISATTLAIYGGGKADNLSATPNIDIYTSSPASTSALANSDFANLGTTSQTGSPITYTGWSTTGYNTFTFNATGRGNVSLTGISKFGARNASYDAANSAPPWVSSATSYLSGYMSGATSGEKPTLVVTYSLVETFSISDTESESESVSIFIKDNISVSDSDTVGEAIKMELTSYINLGGINPGIKIVGP